MFQLSPAEQQKIKLPGMLFHLSFVGQEYEQPGDSSAPCVRLQIVVSEATTYNPRLQTDIIISLYTKMQLWFYINLSFFKKNFYLLFLSVLGLCCCAQTIWLCLGSRRHRLQ